MKSSNVDKTRKKEQFGFFPYTLRIKDPVLRNEYINFQRKEVQNRAMYILIVNAALCMVSFIAYNVT